MTTFTFDFDFDIAGYFMVHKSSLHILCHVKLNVKLCHVSRTRRFVYLLPFARFDFDIAGVCTTFTTIFFFATSSRRKLPNDPG